DSVVDDGWCNERLPIQGCRNIPGPNRKSCSPHRSVARKARRSRLILGTACAVNLNTRLYRKGAKTMAKLSTEELLDAFKELSLLELSEFIKAFEEEFDVTAAAPVAMAAAPAGGGEDTGEAEEQTEFDVVLESA